MLNKTLKVSRQEAGIPLQLVQCQSLILWPRLQRLIYKMSLPEAAKSFGPVCKVVFCDKNYEKLLL